MFISADTTLHPILIVAYMQSKPGNDVVESSVDERDEMRVVAERDEDEHIPEGPDEEPVHVPVAVKSPDIGNDVVAESDEHVPDGHDDEPVHVPVMVDQVEVAPDIGNDVVAESEVEGRVPQRHDDMTVPVSVIDDQTVGGAGIVDWKNCRRSLRLVRYGGGGGRLGGNAPAGHVRSGGNAPAGHQRAPDARALWSARECLPRRCEARAMRQAP